LEENAEERKSEHSMGSGEGVEGMKMLQK